MCGIAGIFTKEEVKGDFRNQTLEMARRVRHRGPDWSGIYEGKKAVLAHERLAIVDPASGKQPLYSYDGQQVLAVNGEIYNHQEWRKKLDYQFKTKSDCEVILALYKAFDTDFLDKINGIFGFALYDEEKDRFLIARDHIGIIPLYYGEDEAGNVLVASELKSLEGICQDFREFPPGHFYDSKTGQLHLWYKRDWKEFDSVKDNPASIHELRDALDRAVKRQLMSDVPYGVLLSGGLDSSITSAIAAKYAPKRVESEDQESAWFPRLHSFAIGLEGSPDLVASKKVADYIGSVHHEITYTIQEGLDALNDVVYQLETYDVTTIRASTPMYLMSRVIKSMGIKMVLSGEGADELFGGYLYFHKAPNAEEFHNETVRKIEKLHLYDCLRANKSLASWGVEGRVPFLDKEFIDVAMRFNPAEKMTSSERIEKWPLRKAFEDVLPDEVAWRQKEQFSDGVGYGWIDSLKDLTQQEVTDEMMAKAAERFPINTPKTKEEYYYRSIFSKHFPSDAAARCVPSVKSVACSTEAALAWDEDFQNSADPSGRAVKNIHREAYK